MSTDSRLVEKEIKRWLEGTFGRVKGSMLYEKSKTLEKSLRPEYFRKLSDIAHAKKEGRSLKAIDVIKDADKHFIPVGVREFVMSPAYLNKADEVYPKVLDHVVAINEGNQYTEAVLTGGIGVAKTTIALYSLAYWVYVLSSYKNVHRHFGLDSSSEILFVFQSINAKLAKDVDFNRFRELIRMSPFFRHKFPYDPTIESELLFPNRIIARPVTGSQTAAIGQNAFGGIIDEVNYMAVTDKSRSSIDGGEYDQAKALYSSISKRRKSRFMKGGFLPGMLFLVSSKRYPGQFTDMKEQEALEEIRETGKTSIYVYDKRAWEILPEDRFCGEFFQVFKGNETRTPYIVSEEHPATEKDVADGLVIDIPIEYIEDFRRDLMEALREIAGVATLAKHPFILNGDDVTQCINENNISILSTHTSDLLRDKIRIYPKKFLNPTVPRAVHIDLALSSDSAGMSCGWVPGFEVIDRQGEKEYLPRVKFDFTLEIPPMEGDEIPYYKIREILYVLTNLGLNIRWVTFDSFQSRDSIQQLRRRGYQSGLLSMDTSSEPYILTKLLLSMGLIEAPEHPKLIKELLSLEKEPKTGRIDHPPKGSKDVSDSMAGVCYTLYSRREIWIRNNIPLNSPKKLREQVLIDS